MIQIVLVLLRFLFDYLRARLQEPISYQLTARDRLAVGDALKRVSLGYFQTMSTGNILNSITTGLSTLENMGIRMIDNFIGGYLNFLVIFVCLAVCSPVTALIALAAAALLFLRRLLLGSMTFFGVIPFLPPVILAVVASFELPRSSVIAGIVFGALCDLVIPAPFACLYTIAFTLAALLISTVVSNLLQQGFARALLSTVLTFLLVDL